MTKDKSLTRFMIKTIGWRPILTIAYSIVSFALAVVFLVVTLASPTQDTFMGVVGGLFLACTLVAMATEGLAGLRLVSERLDAAAQRLEDERLAG